MPPGVTKKRRDLALFLLGQPPVHDQKNRKHQAGYQGRPLQEKPDHDQRESGVLGVAQMGVGSSHGQPAVALRRVENPPCGCNKDEAAADQHAAHQMERTPVWIHCPAEESRPKVARIMGQRVERGEAAAGPAGQQIKRQRKAIHLDKKSDDERRESAQRAPIARRLRLEEAEGEQDEHGRVDAGQQPQALGRDVTGHRDRHHVRDGCRGPCA